MTSAELKLLEDRRDVLRTSVTSLGNWLIGFVAAVVIGLGIELYTPIVSLLNKFDIGVLVDLIGTTLVTLGVAGELAIEWTTHRKEKELLGIDATIEADSKDRIAAMNLKAEQEQLARLKIEQRMRARSLTAEDFDKLIKLLKPRAGKLVDIVVFDHHIVETKLFAGQIFFAFVSAGWKCHQYESRAAKFRIVGPSAIVAVAKDHEGEYKEFADTLAGAMKEMGFDCAARLSSFGFTDGREFKPGEYELTSVHPIAVFGNTRTLSPFRIQIGAMQLAAFPPSKSATVIVRKA